MKIMYGLLAFVPITIVARFVLHLNDGLVFALCCLGIVPLAKVLGDATEQISMYTGPKVGGFLNATMGNVPELLISAFAIKEGLYALVLASLAGSVLGNLLLVMGMSILLGGIKFKFQKFNTNITHNNFTLLGFASFCMMIPFGFQYFTGTESGTPTMSTFSILLAVIMVALYVLGLIFSLITHRDIFHNPDQENEDEEEPEWSLKKGVLILSGAAALVAVMSETLVGTVEGAAAQFGLGEAFIGIILIPILGNVAEHAAALIMAYKGKLDIAIEIAIGSSMQIALFVTPLIVLFSAFLGNTMDYVFTPLELIGLVVSIVLCKNIFTDGKVNWLEGAQLAGAYVILAAAFLTFGIA